MTLNLFQRTAAQQQVLHAPEIVPAGPTLWADVSNYTGVLTDAGCAELKAAGFVGLIIQAITGTNGISYTRQQLSACVRNGLRIQGYIWCWSTPSVLSRLPMFNGYELENLWLDVEQAGLPQSSVDRDLTLCDEYIQKTSHIYSGRWFFADQNWLNLTKWSDQGRLLWDSNYDNNPDVDAGFRPYGGWNQCEIKQYIGTSSIGSVHEIDLNVSR